MYLQERAHPLTVFLYFVSITVVTVATSSTVIVLISLVGAVCFRALLDGTKKTLSGLLPYIPVSLAVVLSNFLFVHDGKTVFFRIRRYAFTLEAILYGVFMALMLVSLFFWGGVIGKALTGDRISALFGRILPRSSLLLIMTLRSFFLLSERFYAISDAQKASGAAFTGRLSRVKSLLSSLSALTTLSLESAIQTGESMRARGYGLPGRKSFAVYVFTLRDAVVSTCTVLLTLFVVASGIAGAPEAAFYPRFSGIDLSPYALTVYAATAALAMIPTITETKDRIRWHFLRSKI